LIDGFERGLKGQRWRLPAGAHVALHPPADRQAGDTAQSRRDLELCRSQALFERLFHREALSNRGRDQPLADGPEELAIGGLLPDGDPGHFPAVVGDIVFGQNAPGAKAEPRVRAHDSTAAMERGSMLEHMPTIVFCLPSTSNSASVPPPTPARQLISARAVHERNDLVPLTRPVHPEVSPF